MTRIVHIIGLLVLLAAGLLPAGASAQDKPMIAILPLQASESTGLSTEDVSYLTDIARGTAAKILGDGYIVLTEHNIHRILGALGLSLEQVEAGDSLVEIARKLQADYAVAGRIRKALGELKLTIQLYETGRGALLEQHDTSARNASALEGSVRDGIASLLSKLPGAAASATGGATSHELAILPEEALGSPKVSARYDREAVRKVIRRKKAAIRVCYEKEREENPELGGKIVLAFVIMANGSVAKPTVKANTMPNPAVGECIAKEARKWRFPEPPDGGIVRVSYPFLFSPKPGEATEPKKKVKVGGDFFDSNTR